MNTILEQIINGLNSGIGFAGSIVTMYDHFKNKDNSHSKEILAAIRGKSKEAYRSYCEYREYRKNDIGTPLERDILGYWESCLERDVLPSADDIVSENIASKEEAEIMIVYLFEAWMGVPEFVEWVHALLAQRKLDELSQALMDFQKNIEGIPGLVDELEHQNISNLAFFISPDRIVEAKHSCTDLDIKQYYMVNNGFMTMFKVISAGYDIPHREARRKAIDLAESCHPVIIAGNGGLGKTSLMMHVAVRWASSGRVVIWLSLSGEDVITQQKAVALFNHLIASIPIGQRGLLCIDNPYEGKVSFSNLQKMWPNNEKIQLIMAERSNRLTLLADPDRDSLRCWFDDAQMLILQGLKQGYPIFGLKGYKSCQFLETQERREKILKKCTSFLVREGIVEENDRISSIHMILGRYAKPTVSLVELIYRTLFELKKRISKPEAIKLDWEEWESFIESEFGKGQSYNAIELYGVIAALKVFNTPITISLFCKSFELSERKLRICLKERLMSQHSEPVVCRGNTLQPKHDVIAELFFLFHQKTLSINDFMLDLLSYMDEDEIEMLLTNMVIKKEFKKGKKYHVGQIHYIDYLDKIYDRMEKHNCNLTETGRAYLCLGFLWCRFQNVLSAKHGSFNDILNKIAPQADGKLLMAKLYTEWGIWARESGDYKLAEEKYRIVVDNYPQQLHARTELGKLLSKQKGREKEAEGYLREAVKIDPKNLHPHTELGKLLSRRKGREKEAEELLREAMQIEPKHIQSRTELGKLLSRQKGRGKEAEELLREAMQIEPKDIQSRTELGKLLSRQKGREKEAEELLREVIKIDSRNLHARTVLAQLFERQDKLKEAQKLYQEVCRLNPGNFYGERGITRLKGKM